MQGHRLDWGLNLDPGKGDPFHVNRKSIGDGKVLCNKASFVEVSG